MKFSSCSLFALAAGLVFAGAALAQPAAYPINPERVVIPWPPGGGNREAAARPAQRRNQQGAEAAGRRAKPFGAVA